MTQWQVGKTYEFIPEMVERFSATNDSNFLIAEILKGRQFTVEEVENGRVINIQGIERFVLLDWWFYPEEIKYFREVNTSTPDEIVIEWLNILQYVYNNSDTISSFDYSSMVLEFTESNDVVGTTSVVEYINKEYARLQEIKSQYQELKSKREQLLAELAEIDKQLGDKL